MAYVPGDRWIRCSHCTKKISISRVVRSRNGTWACPDHADKRQMDFDFPRPVLHEDPQFLNPNQVQLEGNDQFFMTNNWEDDLIVWETDATNWEDN